ncbi:MAG: hypothetical protein AB1646_09705 [Thermodesulfobacteriota bacterium]
MAEFDFILGEHEQLLILDHLIKDGATIVPFLAYERPVWQEIKDSSEAARIIRDRLDYGPFFVSWADQNPYPYEFTAIPRPEGLRYFLGQKQGGPYMGFLASRVVQRDQEQLLTTGFIAYYARYWIDSIGGEIPVSEQLKLKYKMLVKSIKKIATRTHAGIRVYWIGEEAMQLFRSGYSSSIQGLSL